MKQVHFSAVEDIKNLENQRCLSGNSKLKNFNSFLDCERIRVEGYLNNSSLPYDKKKIFYFVAQP